MNRHHSINGRQAGKCNDPSHSFSPLLLSYTRSRPSRRSIIRGGLYWSNPDDASAETETSVGPRCVQHDCTANERTVKRKKKTKRRREAGDPTKADHGRDAARNEEPTPVAFNIRLAPRKVGLPNVTLSSLSLPLFLPTLPSHSLASYLSPSPSLRS